jgi:CDGSH-type Zn-finger protein/uncharacterized Fe-S cluster protein YjdI
MAKEYTNGDITILWQADKCIHSEICIKGLPRVFDNSKRPWIDLKGASSRDIVNQVRKCPSGALAVKDDKTTKFSSMENATIAGTKPVMVDLEAGKTYAWCACGKSSNQPWCDGSHQTTQFRPLIIKTMEPSKAALCMCKQSGSRPYCDGTHNKLTS